MRFDILPQWYIESRYRERGYKPSFDELPTRRSEPLFKAPAHRPAIERHDIRQCNGRLFDAVDDAPSQRFLDHLLHRTATQRQHRRAAGHSLNHGQPERLRPVYEEHQGPSLAKKIGLLLFVDFA